MSRAAEQHFKTKLEALKREEEEEEEEERYQPPQQTKRWGKA